MTLQLYKFSKRMHIRDLVEKGEVYLSPASRFSGNHLSKGAHDPTELYIEERLPDNVEWEVFDGRNGASKGLLQGAKWGPLRSQSDKDYYVFCMSYRYDAALYAEFEADTCLIIRDPDRFINQVGLALRRELPGWSIDAGTVLYLPDKAFFSRHPTYHEIFYTKPSTYRHQCEIRIVCSPATLVPKLQPRTIYAGSIADYTAVSGVERADLLMDSLDWLNAWASPFST